MATKKKTYTAEDKARFAAAKKSKVDTVTADVLALFEDPAALPAALAQTVLAGASGNRHASGWSFGNQLIVALRGYSDARTFKQWKDAGRNIPKGTRSFSILAPVTVRVEDEKDPKKTRTIVVGFKPVAVFGYEQTEGTPISGLGEQDTEATRSHIAGLPCIEVAEAWGLKVKAVPHGGAHGYYSPTGSEIGLAVENLSTWAHELVHAADDRALKAKGRKLKGGQHADQEIVAELGGAVLLRLLGFEAEADLGGCHEYLKAYAGEKALRAANRLADRVGEAVSLILAEAECAASAATSEELVG